MEWLIPLAICLDLFIGFKLLRLAWKHARPTIIAVVVVLIAAVVGIARK